MPRFLTSILIIILILPACKKESAPPPVIEIIRPGHLSYWSVGDSIDVQAQITSSIPLEYIEINLLNTSQITANQPKVIYTNDYSYTLNTQYAITNTSLNDGEYYFMIEASNGDDAEREYVSIQITSIPKQSVALIAFSYNQSDAPHIYKIDSLLQSQQFKELSGDLYAGEVNSENQIIYSMGRYTGSYYRFDAGSGAEVEEIPALINPPFPYFNCLSFGNDLTLMGLYDGYIKGFYNNGNLKFVYYNDLFRPKKLKYDGTYIIGAYEYHTGSTSALGVMWEISGAVKDIVFTTYNTVDFFRISGNLVLLFANEGLSSKLYTLNLDNMIITQIKTLPAGNIYSVIQCGANEFVISHDNGLIVYNYTTNTYGDFSSGSPTGILCFDEVDERIYLSSRNEVYSFTWPGAVQSGPLVLPDTVRDMHILYNR